MVPYLLATLLAFSQPPDATPPDAAEAERLEAEQEQSAAEAAIARQQAEAIGREISALQQQLVELGRRVDASETAALQSEGELDRLNAEEASILQRLNENRETLIDVLAAIQRIESQTPPALMASPDDAAEAARAASLMSELASALRERAAQLAQELDALRDVRASIETEQVNLASAEDALMAQRLELQVMIAERRALEARRRDEAEELLTVSSQAGQRAESIRSLLGEISRMSAVIPSISPRRRLGGDDVPTPRLRPVRGLTDAQAPLVPLQTLRFADARGRLRQPATGAVALGFGDVTEDGTRSEGIFIRTRNGAQVVSPFDAQVEFAGPFNTYGGLLILNVGDDYYIVLAGMAVTYASAGQSVLAGEPVGAMPQNGQTAPELYLELRRNGNAIDPGPWLRSTQ